jgi:hypothetical protein
VVLRFKFLQDHLFTPPLGALSRPAHLPSTGPPQPPPSSIRHRDPLLSAIHLPTELLSAGVANLLLGAINGRAPIPPRCPTTQPICSPWKVGDLLTHDLHGRWSTVDRPLPRAPSSTPSAAPPTPRSRRSAILAPSPRHALTTGPHQRPPAFPTPPSTPSASAPSSPRATAVLLAPRRVRICDDRDPRPQPPPRLLPASVASHYFSTAA